jgi:hypothetical protein
MSLVRINKNPSGRQLAVFGAAWLIFLGISGCLSWSRGHRGAAEAIWVLAALVPLGGTASRSFLRIVYLGLSYATYPIGFAVSHVILVLVYYVVLTPIGLTMRLFGYDPLARRFDAGAKTYWTPRNKAKTVESYFKQG